MGCYRHQVECSGVHARPGRIRVDPYYLTYKAHADDVRARCDLSLVEQPDAEAYAAVVVTLFGSS